MTDDEAIAALLDELYALISGPGSRRRDWVRQAELFLPQARMIRTVIDASGRARPEMFQVEDYPESYERLMGGRDFFEIETSRIVERFGHIAHAFSSYEAYEDAAHTRLLKRGINSIQFYKVDGAWKIAAMVWDDERPDQPLPRRYVNRDCAMAPAPEWAEIPRPGKDETCMSYLPKFRPPIGQTSPPCRHRRMPQPENGHFASPA